MRLWSSNHSEPVNIGNPSEFTITTFAEKIISLCGSKSNIVHKELPVDDPKRRKPDTSKAKALLDWEPRVTLDQGLMSTIEYFRGRVTEEGA